MPIFPDFPDIDPEMIDILIKKEREDQKNAYERPYLQLPTPYGPKNPEYYKEKEEKQDNSEIVIDI
tara:strand:+ start:429 stop:626 length:198 start_codon:yes stop_codon:yes gene_type:complete